MKISERDIFNFVFFPAILSIEKRKYLESIGIYNDEIRFYEELKKDLSDELSAEIKSKIAQRIPNYRFEKIFFLYPTYENNSKRKTDKSILAAASPINQTSITASSFVDEKNQFLIRILKSENKSKIYVFSTVDEVIKNFKIIIKPSGQVFEQQDNTHPICFDKQIEIENIELQFN